MDSLNCVSVGASLPLFVTLTFPDAVFNDSVTEFAKYAKARLDRFLKKLVRVAPEAAGFWRQEWEARKSGAHEGKLFPHFHLMVWGLPQVDHGWNAKTQSPGSVAVVNVKDDQGRFAFLKHLDVSCKVAPCTGGESASPRAPLARGVHHYESYSCYGGVNRHVTAECKPRLWGHYQSKQELYLHDFEGACPEDRMWFSDWASMSWYHVVGSMDVNHFSAGVRTEPVRSWGGVRSYCSKYMAKLSDSEFLQEIPVGRQWGVFNRVNIPWAKMVEVDLPNEVGVRVRRIARRYLERATGRRRILSYGVTLYCDVHLWRRLWENPPDPDPF